MYTTTHTLEVSNKIKQKDIYSFIEICKSLNLNWITQLYSYQDNGRFDSDKLEEIIQLEFIKQLINL